MCDFPSWRKLKDDTVLYLTDKDAEDHGIPYLDAVGHSAISKVFPGSRGEDEEGFPCPPPMAQDIRAGKMRLLAQAGGYQEVVVTAEGLPVSLAYGEDPKDPDSWREEYDDSGRCVARTHGDDPKNPYSWRDEYDDSGRCVARTHGEDPKDPRSWRDEYDDSGRWVACTWSENPKDPRSWRDEYDDSGHYITRKYGGA